MENLFDWMVKVLPTDEVEVWFNIHNIHREKIELFGDVFLTVFHLISQTYLGDEFKETKIDMSDVDIKNHFDWCWTRTLKIFEKEKIVLNTTGEHRDYIESFFMDTFYYPINNEVKENLPSFLKQTFRMSGNFTKSDLEILTEIYKLMEKSMNHLSVYKLEDSN